MTVRLHKVTLFVVEPHGDIESPMDKLVGDCYHNSGARIVADQMVVFDREWDDDDPLNKELSASELERMIDENSPISNQL